MSNKRHTLSRIFHIVALTLIFFFAANLLPARAQSGSLPEFVRGEVLVEIKPGATIEAVTARFGMTLIQHIYGTNFYKLRTPNGKKEAKFRKRLAADPDVLSAALNPVITTPINVFGRSVIGFPGDRPIPGQPRAQYLGQQLAGDLAALQARSTGTGVIVAVIDTGVDRNHPDVSNHIWTDPGETPGDLIDNDNDGLVDDVFGWNFLSSSNDTMEQPDNPNKTVAGHGTFIAGLITLIAPDVKIMPVRAFSREGVSDAFTIAQAIKYAVDHGAKIINLSFGTSEDSQVMHDAVNYAEQRGVLMIAAVGNENKGNDAAPQFPANWSTAVMGVAALDASDRKANFSNFGTDVSVSALGVNLVSAYPESNNAPDYALWSGTSFAAPLATAEAALLLEKAPLQQSVRDIIESNTISIDAHNPGFAGKLGKGRIDPLAALGSLNPIVTNRSEIALNPSGVEPTAAGQAEVSIAGAEQDFEIEAQQLTPYAVYKIVVNGNVIIDNTTDLKAVASNFGTFKIEFSTPQKSDHPLLPAALNPVTNIKTVEIRDALDRLILSNTFGAPQPGGGSVVEKEARLTSSGSARGSARAEIESERQKLRVEADRLQSGVAYQIVADSVSLGSFAAQSGYLKVEFTSDASSGHLLPAALQPVTKIVRITILDPAGQTVLEGTFQSGGDDFGGGGGDDGGGDDGGGSGGGGGGGGGSGGGGADIQKEASLNPSGVDADAKGKVKTKVSGSTEELEIEGDKLVGNAAYVIVVDGFLLATVTTDSNGSFKLTLSSESGSLPSQVRPVSNIQHIQVWDAQNRIVLTGGPPS